ncbi:MAG: hypothetical protein NUV65_06070 [Candidatus Roizmanbacteria bacterium]|nr:hypothetical protein [Candidatus Roizmanbacteria bacterium]
MALEHEAALREQYISGGLSLPDFLHNSARLTGKDLPLYMLTHIFKDENDTGFVRNFAAVAAHYMFNRQDTGENPLLLMMMMHAQNAQISNPQSMCFAPELERYMKRAFTAKQRAAAQNLSYYNDLADDTFIGAALQVKLIGEASLQYGPGVGAVIASIMRMEIEDSFTMPNLTGLEIDIRVGYLEPFGRTVQRHTPQGIAEYYPPQILKPPTAPTTYYDVNYFEELTSLNRENLLIPRQRLSTLIRFLPKLIVHSPEVALQCLRALNLPTRRMGHYEVENFARRLMKAGISMNDIERVRETSPELYTILTDVMGALDQDVIKAVLSDRFTSLEIDPAIGLL